MTTLTDARKLLDGKTSVPSELRTAQWARVPQWLRERSFYMAGVYQAEILDGFKKEVAAIAQGDSSIPESERRLSEMLTEIGYTPKPGQEGTIKDLRLWRRMRVSLRTNVELLQGWGQKQRSEQRGAVMTQPAWELVRVMPRKMPRDWQARFSMSGGVAQESGRMIALKGSRVWEELGGSFEDGLGVDYPPFAWGSGMGWRGVGFREAEKLGLIPPDWAPPPREPVSSPNETLEMKPKISDRALRDALAERMQGMAEWQGEKLVFTDPNGTRPMTGEKLTEVWGRGMPQKFWNDVPKVGSDEGLGQRLALQLWSEDHDAFTREDDGENAPGRLNLFDDLLRLFKRLLPMPGNKTVYRGMAWKTEKEMNGFLEAVRKGKLYAPLPNKPADSWSVAASGARKYEAKAAFSVRLVCENHHSAKDISVILRSIKDRLRNPDPKHPLVTDGEVVFANGAKFRLLRIERGSINSNQGEATVYVQQL